MIPGRPGLAAAIVGLALAGPTVGTSVAGTAAAEAPIRAHEPDAPASTRLRLTAEERARGWRLLFDGVRTDAWRAAGGDAFPDRGWRVEDGALVLDAAGPLALRAGGDLVSRERFRDFEFAFEFALSEGANSGVKYLAEVRTRLGFAWAFGCEYQLLDDERHPDARAGRDGNRRLAALYDVLPANGAVFRGVGHWNAGTIRVKGRRRVHTLNGVRVVDVEVGSTRWREALAASKFAEEPDFCAGPSGHLVLQDHGDAVRFRNLRIRSLDRVDADS